MNWATRSWTQTTTVATTATTTAAATTTTTATPTGGDRKKDHFKIVFIVESRSMTSGSNSNEIVFVEKKI